MDKTALGDRMKSYENLETQRKFMPGIPIVARLDGRSFSKFTKGMRRPYDEDFSTVMRDLTKYLVEETNADVGYQQSDELTLIWSNQNKDMLFGGRIFKITSTLSAICSVEFNRLFKQQFKRIGNRMSKDVDSDVYLAWKYKQDKAPTFDCRAFQVPDLDEASNCVLWRERDATKNSVSMSAQSMFSHKELQGKNSSQMMDKMMLELQVNWNDYPSFFKKGTYFRRSKEFTKFSTEEIENLPLKHAARLNPDLKVERSVVKELDIEPISRYGINVRVELLFK